MRWYVMIAGEAVGPMDGATVQQFGREKKLLRGAYVREENGPWMPVEASPFAALVPVAKPKSVLPDIVMWCGLALLVVALFFGGCSVIVLR